MPRPSSAAAQLADAVLPYVLLWGLLAWTLGIPYWVTLAMAALTTVSLISTFLALRAPLPTRSDS